MGGGLMQLVAYGAQDVYLTGNPQITFFKAIYKRHTNFAIESIEQSFNGSIASGNQVTCIISRNGDLIGQVVLSSDVVTTAQNAGGAPTGNCGGYPGESVCKEVEIEIGGQRIDKHYSDWFHCWSQLTMDDATKSKYYRLIGHTGRGVLGNTTTSVPQARGATAGSYKIWTPLQFWFCKNPGLFLPLIALQYHDVKITITFTDAQVAAGTTPDTSITSINDAQLWVDYIFLDTEERRRFSQTSHEYLIEQLQFTGTETVTTNSTNTLRLNFNHPCKELIWHFKPDPETSISNSTSFGCYTNTAPTWGVHSIANISSWSCNSASQTTDGIIAGTDTLSVRQDYCEDQAPLESGFLELNGHDRFAPRVGDYFNLVQPFQYHSGNPHAGIYCYSFALRPEDHQPSGTCNFSRIDNATLQLTLRATGTTVNLNRINIFAVNYNILRIMSGMGGLAYSN